MAGLDPPCGAAFANGFAPNGGADFANGFAPTCGADFENGFANGRANFFAAGFVKVFAEGRANGFAVGDANGCSTGSSSPLSSGLVREVTDLKAALRKLENSATESSRHAPTVTPRSFFGNRKVNPSRDLDENTLVKVAESTGGRYFRARNADELNNIYRLLDKLEPVEKDKQYFRPRSELYYWPLALALGLAGFIALSRVRLS